ncbi:hypothetical protein TEA_022600 [Camellia sinensis var. sinensis]|uniref:Ribosome assembly factor mrt4 n=1 Tax=Camellia sinensis var. sinensis TaxID=542762 RepID=A0A4S4DS10_CAMSN|nr:hypothetical protein TEA_022600 [Camellia sinensis var. sinensis]
MPKSKRDRPGLSSSPRSFNFIHCLAAEKPDGKRGSNLTLSKTKKKGRGHKESIVNSIREEIEKYNSVYVFSFENMRNLKFKEFRDKLKSSSRGGQLYGLILCTKTYLAALCDSSTTFGHQRLIRGDSGLCFTNLPKEEVQRLFNEFEEYDFARTGSIASEKVELKEGPLDQFTHEMEPFLRKQGMPVRLNRGVVELVSDFVVCEEGKPLSPESARILGLTILGTMDVDIETDATQAIKLIQDGPSHNSPYKAIIEDTRPRLFWVKQRVLGLLIPRLSHTLREGNKVADRLANIGVAQDEQVVILEDPPEDVTALVIDDMSGAHFERD